MQILLATEIWGRTSHVDEMVRVLERCSHTVTVIDPYAGSDPAFVSEEEAYSRYQEVCGHGEYARRVAQALERAAGPVCLVGFSAGAGAVWSAVTEAKVGPAVGAIGFYGSSIRTMMQRIPHIPVTLIFPCHEAHFDVGGVVEVLQDLPETACHVVPYGHGFMNPLSDNYSAKGHALWTRWLLEQIASMARP
ncbi:dienelactone hydrolase family protein [Pseudodesulfovibrio sediminis]|uniref:Dienelactone hydrolase n=1 Tax=Pseudodesulfovibrio sediminis TaxID=2810563 RepID=A0ABM8I389_9BACT|nr:dienelactone hydrolase family protein [Pseudodesulfovibrio sediminis]BCS87966.1 dienelactone hydrolase [Pseudodesulfovibrio sediminis]